MGRYGAGDSDKLYSDKKIVITLLQSNFTIDFF